MFHNPSLNTHWFFVFFFFFSYQTKSSIFCLFFWMKHTVKTVRGLLAYMLWIRQWKVQCVCVFFFFVKGCTQGRSGAFDEAVQLSPVCSVVGGSRWAARFVPHLPSQPRYQLGCISWFLTLFSLSLSLFCLFFVFFQGFNRTRVEQSPCCEKLCQTF